MLTSGPSVSRRLRIPDGDLFRREDRRTGLEVRLENQTVWLPQSQIAELFQTTKQDVSLHLRNIFDEAELEPTAVVKEYLTTAADGKSLAVVSVSD